jgi:L-threonylcarbamoyladenylate synthase
MPDANQTGFLPTRTPDEFRRAVHCAAELLRAGEVVALPTETVYGLAANALDADAVARIFSVKGRPSYNPIIVHVAGIRMARQCVKTWTETANRLAASFWPGPLTMVLARSARIPDVVTAGGPTVGVRWPNHPFIQAVIRTCGFPLAAPSANLSNCVSPTSANHVRHQLGGLIPLIVDGGPCCVGIESTVVDATSVPLRVLRPGMIHEETLSAILSDLIPARSEGGEMPSKHAHPGGEALRSPGMLTRHYAPVSKLYVWRWRDEADLKAKIKDLRIPLDSVHILAREKIPSRSFAGRLSVMPHDAMGYARALYAELHACDTPGLAAIVVESPPDHHEWAGVADRLRRASAKPV